MASNSLAALVVETQCVATMHSRLARIHARTLPPVTALSLTSLSPNSATAGGSAFTLTVNGSNFVSGATEIPKLKLVMQWNRHNDQDAVHAWLRQRLLAVAREA